MRSAFLALAAWLALVGSAHALALRCTVADKFVCEQSGCRPQQTNVWNVIDFDTSRLSRCDLRGCDHYDMLVARSGVYWNIEAPARSLFAKVSDDGSSFVEVAAVQAAVQVSYGSCQKYKQPN